jgi:O-acetyl-ADP-ribose deacetylase (regulator of RNase III)
MPATGRLPDRRGEDHLGLSSARRLCHTRGRAGLARRRRQEAALLAGCYVNSLRLAAEHAIGRIAFPAISCGIYRYPVDRAAEIAVRETAAFLDGSALPEEVIFACFDKHVHAAYLAAMRDRKPVDG